MLLSQRVKQCTKTHYISHADIKLYHSTSGFVTAGAQSHLTRRSKYALRLIVRSSAEVPDVSVVWSVPASPPALA